MDTKGATEMPTFGLFELVLLLAAIVIIIVIPLAVIGLIVFLLRRKS